MPVLSSKRRKSRVSQLCELKDAQSSWLINPTLLAELGDGHTTAAERNKKRTKREKGNETKEIESVRERGTREKHHSWLPRSSVSDVP